MSNPEHSEHTAAGTTSMLLLFIHQEPTISERFAVAQLDQKFATERTEKIATEIERCVTVLDSATCTKLSHRGTKL
ncbi:hypothetical protein NW762_003283 [Fusarium torreyae]|uniref:Uncharacterized protein n=1 Tax=Fusarium torreyae TaxID=1237075 RepID=A0A9W8SAN5_9HYPO|nr:hypothetical protein NW762_003283 [Fusarium torreyae]